MTGRADLVVVGTGPAGSAVAYHAAGSGLDVLLLDRQEFPRDKPCGDGLMPHAAYGVALGGVDQALEVRESLIAWFGASEAARDPSLQLLEFVFPPPSACQKPSPALKTIWGMRPLLHWFLKRCRRAQRRAISAG